MSDLENRRRAVQIANQLPKSLPDALATLAYSAQIARFTSGQVDSITVETMVAIPVRLSDIREVE